MITNAKSFILFTPRPDGYPNYEVVIGGGLDDNHYVAKLQSGPGRGVHRIGPSIVLKVMAGDSINISAFSWYKQNTTSPGTPTSPFTDLVTNMINAVSGSAVLNNHGVTSGDLTGAGTFTSGITDFLNNQDSYAVTTKPQAFLNWVFFDEQFNYVAGNSGFDQVGADSTLKQHVETGLPVGRSGYLYVYVNNESPNIPVYFDNLVVTHIRGKLLETDEYYPYGLAMKNISYRAAGTMQNRSKYNGGNDFEDEGELNYSNTFFRKYDSQIGRFTGVDIFAEQSVGINPFEFGSDNPIMFNDISGALSGLMSLQNQGGNSNVTEMYDWFHHMWDTYSTGSDSQNSGSGGGGGQSFYEATQQLMSSPFGGSWQNGGYAHDFTTDEYKDINDLFNIAGQIYNSGQGSDPNNISNIHTNGSQKIWNDLYTLTKDVAGAILLAGIKISNISVNIDDNFTAAQTMTGITKDPGVTSVNIRDNTASVSYNSSYAGYDDKAYGTSFLVLAHELFHVLDVSSFERHVQNPVMDQDRNSTALNDYWKGQSAEKFGGHSQRLYFESRAVAYEGLIRFNQGGNLLPARTTYGPFTDAIFSSWILSATNLIRTK